PTRTMRSLPAAATRAPVRYSGFHMSVTSNAYIVPELEKPGARMVTAPLESGVENIAASPVAAMRRSYQTEYHAKCILSAGFRSPGTWNRIVLDPSARKFDVMWMGTPSS